MFTGIPVAALDFYEDLEADNSKAWWTAHKDVYDHSVREPITALAAELESEFGAAKVFRPYRDVRFSKDKTPYKTAQGAFAAVAPSTGYYIQVDASGLVLAGGCYHGSTEQIGRYRAAVDREDRGKKLERILAKLRKAGFEIGGERLKTVPRGYDADHPRIELLRHKSLTARINVGCPDWLETPQALDEVRASWRALRPLVQWLHEAVG
ncbi:DUF2461 domain-containing protein [Aldersonia sp. NBC_00410]|uniref:DUF2461 domain-containing protein n=1 Tax=Aldersonia sp. NBC_00410 TaxID=2975954 RepID=UPI002250ED0E|nr:DUF2461 domain-containing protein [Aldersonia sp. NBC_00410]MCX5045520.1 DUF2461 domain-containing protein [Aldersonia sp. NBC_00410]